MAANFEILPGTSVGRHTNRGMSMPGLNADLNNPVWEKLGISPDVEAMLADLAVKSRDLGSTCLELPSYPTSQQIQPDTSE